MYHCKIKFYDNMLKLGGKLLKGHCHIQIYFDIPTLRQTYESTNKARSSDAYYCEVKHLNNHHLKG